MNPISFAKESTSIEKSLIGKDCLLREYDSWHTTSDDSMSPFFPSPDLLHLHSCQPCQSRLPNS